MKLECNCGKKFHVADFQDRAICPECGALLFFDPAKPYPRRYKRGYRKCACTNPHCNYYGWMERDADVFSAFFPAFMGLFTALAALILSTKNSESLVVIAYFLPLLIWSGSRRRRRQHCPLCGTSHE